MTLQAYRNEVRCVMHNSDDPESMTAAVRLYLDESGGDDPNTPHAVVGGMVINKNHFQVFEYAWDAMLDSHGIAPPLHMKEFGKHGRFSDMSECCRRELFQEVAYLVDRHKVLSLDAELSNVEYKNNLPETVRNRFSVYGMCFLLAVVMNHKIADANVPQYTDKIPFILDSGNPYADHVRKAHAAVLQFQNNELYLHAGSLTFGDDRDFGTLQAADVIAWGARRRISGKPMPYAFEAIGDILDSKNGHNSAAWTSKALFDLGELLARRVAEQEAKHGGKRY